MKKRTLGAFIVDVDDNGIIGNMVNRNDGDGNYVFVNRKGRILNGLAPFTSIRARFSNRNIDVLNTDTGERMPTSSYSRERNARHRLIWINKFSGESGYVKRVMYKDGHFINTFDANEAKTYRSREAVLADIKKLIEMGEGGTNDFAPEACE